MKNSIKPDCIVLDKVARAGNRRQWEIDENGKLWACCVWIQGWDYSLNIRQDDKLEELLKDNPDFNDLNKYTWEEITENPIYKSYINFEGWESDNPPLICVKNCGCNGTEHNQHNRPLSVKKGEE